MATLIVSILFWCMPEKKKLGNAAIALSIAGAIADMIVAGWWCIINIITLIVNICVYTSKKDKE